MGGSRPNSEYYFLGEILCFFCVFCAVFFAEHWKLDMGVVDGVCLIRVFLGYFDFF